MVEFLRKILDARLEKNKCTLPLLNIACTVQCSVLSDRSYKLTNTLLNSTNKNKKNFDSDLFSLIFFFSTAICNFRLPNLIVDLQFSFAKSNCHLMV